MSTPRNALDLIQGRLVVGVPEAGVLLGLGRDASYAAASRGELPTLRFGRRLVVPVPKLLELLGAPSDVSEPAMSDTAGSSMTSTSPKDHRREHPNATPPLRAV